jgi:flagellar biosynthesis/type III secretory pathway protein FliH
MKTDEDPFDVFETAEIDSTEEYRPPEEEEEEPASLKSARDFLKHRVYKSQKDGSPAWKSGFSEGYMMGLKEGKKIGFQNGYHRAVKDAKLPD